MKGNSSELEKIAISFLNMQWVFVANEKGIKAQSMINPFVENKYHTPCTEKRSKFLTKYWYISMCPSTETGSEVVENIDWRPLFPALIDSIL